ncbi:transcriptional regulator with XRE-family HTH domain [Kibdelosporangium banguiense]|uniref:Transcriptional regulator with XRE-family HTH domain n=1 Tax=Kibdelosporangium banguiense TaxID=1365924 RepID=A0ABS4TM33_9PSEU|nr:helix-turn-helix transcriptional regulator [Kibdelosporangium banguiense]MBP2325467.1 transcriptional regulator with XRE-family HTH domain [Kibdelosporangium banguiense]
MRVGQARPTVERRQLGLTLRRLRERAGRTQHEAAAAIGKARTKIVVLEEGVSTATDDDLVALLNCFGVRGPERKTVLELGAQARKRQKRRVYVDTLPDAYDRFADMEANATEISCYESGIIPGPLQSAEYARAVIEECDGIWWEKSKPEGENRLNFRLRRLETLWGSTEPKQLRYVLTEDALHANMGQPEVMRGQLRHLLSLLYRRDDLAIRMLPNHAYGNPARGGGLTIFGFGDRAAPVGYSPAVYGSSTYYDEPADVAALRRAFDRIWELSLSERESKRLITELEET